MHSFSFYNTCKYILVLILILFLQVIMYQRLFLDELTKFWRNFNSFVVIFGTIAGAVSFILSFVEIVKSFKEDDVVEDEVVM